jgi:hypothetical protein
MAEEFPYSVEVGYLLEICKFIIDKKGERNV